MRSGRVPNDLKIIITADKGGGKTTFIKSVAELLAWHDIPHAGFYAEGSWDGNARSSFSLTLLPELTIMPLCDRTSEEWQSCGRFRYNPAALEKGNEIIKRSGPDDIVLMDEIGRQELEGRVWAGALGIAMRMNNPLILSVQLRYLEGIIEMLKPLEFTVYNGSINPWPAIFNEVTANILSK
ncbi:MAG: DUF2478 domain-containing protein [Spirochaetes bacterium]|nr:DUF2478 domain-containing protein [Spirochaetota bacterium]